jgi:hypothetical protein
MTIRGPATACSPPPTPCGRRGYLAHIDDKQRARLNVISHVLGQVPHKPIHRKKVTLPDRDEPGNYTEPDTRRRYIPTPVLTGIIGAP